MENLNIVEFTSNCFPISDYDIEEKFQEYKKHSIIKICNELMLHRYRVGVVKGEIEPFRLIVTDFDGKEYEGIIKDKTWPFIDDIKILSQLLNNMMDLI